MLAGRSDRADGAMVPGLHVAVRLPHITACWARVDGPQEGHVMELNLLSTGTLPSKMGEGGDLTASVCTDISLCSEDNRHGLTTAGSGSGHSAW